MKTEFLRMKKFASQNGRCFKRHNSFSASKQSAVAERSSRFSSLPQHTRTLLRTRKMQEHEGCDCATFWGPTKPFIGGESGEEAGCSCFLGNKVFTGLRCLIFAFLLSTLFYLIATRKMSLLYVTNWSYLLFTISYSGLVLCSVLLVMGKWSTCDVAAKCVIPTYFVAASAALFIIPVYYALLGKPPFTFTNIVTHGGTFVAHMVEVMAGARYRFCLQYSLLCIAYILVYVAFLWARYAIQGSTPGFKWPYGFLDLKKTPISALVGIYIGLLIWCLVSSLIVILTTRISTTCVSNKPSRHPSRRRSSLV